MTKNNLLDCPVCHETAFFRANVVQDVDVTVDRDGRMTKGDVLSIQEIDESGALFCSNCGEHLCVVREGATVRIILDE